MATWLGAGRAGRTIGGERGALFMPICCMGIACWGCCPWPNDHSPGPGVKLLARVPKFRIQFFVHFRYMMYMRSIIRMIIPIVRRVPVVDEPFTSKR